MELLPLLLELSPLFIGIGLLVLDVTLMLRLYPTYYRLTCRLPTRSVALPTKLPDDARLEGDQLEVRLTPGSIQARSTRKKHHILLQIDRDGRARAGTTASMWLCLLVYLGMLVLMAAAALEQPSLTALLFIAILAAMLAGLGHLLRWRTRAMVDDVERLLARDARPGALLTSRDGSSSR